MSVFCPATKEPVLTGDCCPLYEHPLSHRYETHRWLAWEWTTIPSQLAEGGQTRVWSAVPPEGAGTRGDTGPLVLPKAGPWLSAAQLFAAPDTGGTARGGALTKERAREGSPEETELPGPLGWYTPGQGRKRGAPLTRFSKTPCRQRTATGEDVPGKLSPNLSSW